MLVAREISVRYPGAAGPALRRLSLEARPNELVAVVGPNGSGKTSLVRAMIGAVTVVEGSVELDGRPIATWSAADRGRRISFVAQREEYPFAWRVSELVEFGRYPWLGVFGAPGAHDRAVVARSMARADVTDLGDRRIDTLSGGEWQRVRIARALAQESQVLVLDEPTAALDLGHEMGIFELIRELVDEGLAAVVVTHQLNLAARYADRMLLLHHGEAVAQGGAARVLDPGLLERVFGWPVEVSTQVDGVPQLTTRRKPRSRP